MHATMVGYDYANYLYSQGIYGTMYVNNLEVLGERINLINIIRNSIFNVFNKILTKEEGSLIIGMLIGDTTYIPDDVIESFKDSGISHLLAVSGSNVAFVIILTRFVFDKLFGKKISVFLSIGMIIVFIFVSGCSLSVIRAGLMAIILIAHNLLLKREDTISAISLSCILILLFNPLSICDVGFVLSYGGTIGIVLLNKRINMYLKDKLNSFKKLKVLNELIDIFSVTLSAQIVLIPVLNYFFNTVSFVSFLTNLLVGPFVGIVTIYGFILYIVGLMSLEFANFISFPLNLFVKLIIFISKICSLIPFGTIHTPTISLLGIFIYYLIVIRVFFIKNYTKQISYTIIILIILHVLFLVLPRNYVKVNMIDVSQGDSILITTTHGNNILIDGGGSENSDYDIGEKILVPYLLDNTNGVIDAIIISHFHEDHAEGIISVLNELNVNRIIIGSQPCNSYFYNEVLRIAKYKNIQLLSVAENDRMIIDDVKLSFLYPSKRINIQNDMNNNSLIVRADIYDTSILFTGDAEYLEEQKILNNSLIDCDVLKVGHHGSNTSSSDEFLSKVTPNICLISCGVDNKFKHPHIEALNRLNAYTNKIYRTDLNGEIQLKIYKNKRIIISKLLAE